MTKFINKLDNNTLAWFFSSFFTTLIFGKSWVQGTFDIPFSTQIVLYVLTIIFLKRIYKIILEM